MITPQTYRGHQIGVGAIRTAQYGTLYIPTIVGGEPKTAERAYSSAEEAFAEAKKNIDFWLEGECEDCEKIQVGFKSDGLCENCAAKSADALDPDSIKI